MVKILTCWTLLSDSSSIFSTVHLQNINFSTSWEFPGVMEIIWTWRMQNFWLKHFILFSFSWELRSMKNFRGTCGFVMGCLCTFIIFSSVNLNRDNSAPELHTKEFLIEEDLLLIDQNIEDENIQSDRNVYFIETRDTQFHSLDARQACSIESAGKFLMTSEKPSITWSRRFSRRTILSQFSTRLDCNYFLKATSYSTIFY